jgi:hypothetical protein
MASRVRRRARGGHQVVPALLGVEHGRPQLAARRDSRPRQRLVGHPGLDVAELLQAQRVGQALGRVDGEHQHLAAQVGGGHRRGRGGGRGLAHPARTAGDHDLLGGAAAARACGRASSAVVRRLRPPSELLGQQLGDLPGGPGPVGAGEQVGHVDSREAMGQPGAQRGQVPGPGATQRDRQLGGVEDRGDVAAPTAAVRSARPRSGVAERSNSASSRSVNSSGSTRFTTTAARSTSVSARGARSARASR